MARPGTLRAVDLDLRAGIGTRFVAALIDSAFLALAWVVLAVFVDDGVVAGVVSVAAVAYTAWFEARRDGQTIGKKVMGIRVVDSITRGPLEPRQAVVRAVARYISGAAALVGFLWALFDRETRAWHDFAAQTLVVPTDE